MTEALAELLVEKGVITAGEGRAAGVAGGWLG